MSKLMTAILVGLFILAPISLGQSPAPADSKSVLAEQDNWKTYQSQWHVFEGPNGAQTLRFTIKYPADWFVVLDGPTGVVLANFVEESHLDHRKPGGLMVYVGAHTDTAIHGEWVERQLDDPVTLWFTGCLNPLSVDLFVTKEDPNLDKNKGLLLKIAGTLLVEVQR